MTRETRTHDTARSRRRLGLAAAVASAAFVTGGVLLPAATSRTPGRRTTSSRNRSLSPSPRTISRLHRTSRCRIPPLSPRPPADVRTGAGHLKERPEPA